MTCAFCFPPVYLWTMNEKLKDSDEKIRIKGYTVGEGKPLICVPVVGRSQEDILMAARMIVAKKVPVAEWRMDWYAQVHTWDDVRETLWRLAEICKDTILLCTFRSKKQGGEDEMPEEEYQELLLRIARSGKADLLDVETEELSRAEHVIQEIHETSALVLASQHYFSHTPETACMEQELQHMREIGADIGKIAVMPEKPIDVVRLLEATASVKERCPDYPIVTMSMGGMGTISRISGQTFGSCITFASLEQKSAPGQLPVEDMSEILDKIAENMGCSHEA